MLTNHLYQESKYEYTDLWEVVLLLMSINNFPVYVAYFSPISRWREEGEEQKVICDALRNEVLFLKFKKGEQTHRRVSLLIKLLA